MNVLLLEEPLARDVQSGHNVQLQKTAEYLAKLGVKVTISNSKQPNFTKTDIVHAFSADPTQFINLIRSNKPYVMSSVYAGHQYMFGYWGSVQKITELKRKIKLLLTPLIDINYSVFDAHQLCYNYLQYLRNANHLLPNSQLEKELLIKELKLKENTLSVVPNAVDIGFAKKLNTNLFYNKYKLKDYILMVGRIEPHKNQLGLLRAVRGLKKPVVLIGQLRHYHQAYYNACRRINKSFLHIQELTGDMLISAYQNAALHVLPSFFETTGLVTLEAALAGTKVVSTERGYTREYFENYIEYCDPDSPASIRHSIIKTLKKDDSDLLKIQEKIKKHYTWEVTAQKTLAVYKKVLAKK
jgi:glycosyltransferase involved in cell wall biosynthesis